VGCLRVLLVPVWLSMEDVRLVSFKDRVDVSYCLTQFIIQPKKVSAAFADDCIFSTFILLLIVGSVM
jgi:hypothetical protein